MTIRELAKQIGVSPSSVSLVLNNRPGVRRDLRNTIQKHLLANGYQIKQDADAGEILLLNVTQREIPFPAGEDALMHAFLQIQQSCQQHHFRADFRSVRSVSSVIKLSEQELQKVRGILLVGTELDAPLDPALLSLPVPVVIINRSLPAHAIDTVNIDNILGAHQAVSYLHAHGHRRIAYLRCGEDIGSSPERSAAFHQAFSNFGISLPASCQLSVRLDGRHIQDEVSRFLYNCAERPSAIVADNDYIALSAMQAAHRLGLHIPRDLSIIGFDDSALCQLASTPLTTIRIDFPCMADAALSILMDRIHRPQGGPAIKSTVATTLIERQSVARI